MATTPLVLAWLRAVRDTKLSRDAKALAGVLVTYADPDGSSCRPGDDRLRDDLANDRGRPTGRSVSRYRKELIEAGLLVLVRPGAGPGRGKAHGGWAAEWRLVLPRQNTGQRERGVSQASRNRVSSKTSKTPDSGSGVFPQNTRQREAKTPDSGRPPTSPRDLPNSLSAREDLANRLPDFSASERDRILTYIETNFTIRGARDAYLKGWSTPDLREIGEKVRAEMDPGRREITCSTHHITYLEGAECRSCAADRKAADP